MTAAPEFIQALRDSYSFFIAYFQGPHLNENMEVPDFHVITFAKMCDVKIPRAVIALPRGSAKTTIAKLSVLYHLLFTEYRFPLYCSSAHDIAVEAVKDIWNYLISEEYAALTGLMPEKISVQESHGSYKFRMRYFPEGGDVSEYHYKIVNIFSRGSNQALRGVNRDHKRPDLLVLDDVETLENADTPIALKKIARWAYATVFKALDQANHRVIHIGNLIHAESLLMAHLLSPHWTSMRFGILKDDMSSLWPDVWPLSRIREDYGMYAAVGQQSTWYAEMMNIVHSPDASLVDISAIQYERPPLPEDDRILGTFITVDPAISKSPTADDCAIVVHALLSEGYYMPVEHFTKRGMAYDELYSRVKALAEKWYVSLVGIEDQAFQKVLLPVFSSMAGVDAWRVKFVGIPTGNIAKVVRLRGWAGLLTRGEIRLPQGDTAITAQLVQYNKQSKQNRDDLIDACSMGVTMLGTHEHTIVATRASGLPIASSPTTTPEAYII